VSGAQLSLAIVGALAWPAAVIAIALMLRPSTWKQPEDAPPGKAQQGRRGVVTERTFRDEVNERLELRGITPEQVLTDPLAELQYCQIAIEVCDDLLIQRGEADQ